MTRTLGGLALLLPAVGLANEPDDVFGGKIVSRTTAYAVVGYADVEGGLKVPLGGGFELGGRVRFAFPGGCCGGAATPFAGVPALDFRWQVFDNGELRGAVVASVPVQIGFGPGYPFGVGIGLLSPGWRMTYTIEDKVDASFGLRFHDDLWVFPGEAVVFLGAVTLDVGMQVRVAPKIGVGFQFEGGPQFGVSTATTTVYGLGTVTVAGSGTGARLRAVAGAVFAL